MCLCVQSLHQILPGVSLEVFLVDSGGYIAIDSLSFPESLVTAGKTDW